MALGFPVFFRQTVVGEHLADESGAHVEPQLGERVGDVVHVLIGLAAPADDQCLDLLGAFRRCVRSSPFGQKVGQRPMENGVADIVGGFARFEAETVGELVLGEIAQFPEGDHTDLLLDGLLLGEGDGLPVMVGENERAILAQDCDIESDMHVDTSHMVGVHDTREREVMYT